MANSQSQDLNLQRGDRALHSSLQEWMTQQSKCETTDQGNGKALRHCGDLTTCSVEPWRFVRQAACWSSIPATTRARLRPAI